MRIAITFEGAQPPTGTLEVTAGGGSQPFVGWLDLLALLSEVLAGWDRGELDS